VKDIEYDEALSLSQAAFGGAKPSAINKSRKIERHFKTTGKIKKSLPTLSN
jgi:hypothetical protein